MKLKCETQTNLEAIRILLHTQKEEKKCKTVVLAFRGGLNIQAFHFRND